MTYYDRCFNSSNAVISFSKRTKNKSQSIKFKFFLVTYFFSMLIDRDHQIEVDMNDLHSTLMYIVMVVLIKDQVHDVIVLLFVEYLLYWLV